MLKIIEQEDLSHVISTRITVPSMTILAQVFKQQCFEVAVTDSSLMLIKTKHVGLITEDLLPHIFKFIAGYEFDDGEIAFSVRYAANSYKRNSFTVPMHRINGTAGLTTPAFVKISFFEGEVANILKTSRLSSQEKKQFNIEAPVTIHFGGDKELLTCDTTYDEVWASIVKHPKSMEPATLKLQENSLRIYAIPEHCNDKFMCVSDEIDLGYFKENLFKGLHVKK